MSNPEQAYGNAVRQHLEEAFPNSESLPHTVNLITDDWRNAIIEKCPVPKGMKEVDAHTVIGDVLYAWLHDQGHENVGDIWVNGQRRDAAAQAQAAEKARKQEAELAPLANLMRATFRQVLVEAGLAKSAGIVPASNVVQHPTAHATKKGPGRRGNSQ